MKRMEKTKIKNPKEQEEKKIALKFFDFIMKGRPMDARNLFSSDCVHHYPYLPAGMDSLLEAMGKAQEREDMPRDGRFDIKHVMADGNLVAVYTTLQSKSDKSKGFRQIHLFRFSRDKIVEYWDVTQMPPENSQNAFRMF